MVVETADLTSLGLRQILEHVSEGILVLDEAGRVLFATVQAAQIAGFRDAEAMRGADAVDLNRWWSLRDEDGAPLEHDRHPFHRALKEAARVEQLIRYHALGSREERWATVTASPIDKEGRRFVITSIRDVTEVHRAEEAWHFLAEASMHLGSSLDYGTTLKAVARLAVPKVADWCAVEMRGDDGARRLAVAHVDPSKVVVAEEMRHRYPPREGDAVSIVLLTGEPLLVSEITDEQIASAARDPQELSYLRELGLRSVMLVPIVVGAEAAGVISFVAAESGRRYGPADLRLAQEIARRAALAIKDARLYAQAQEAISARDMFLSVASHELKTPLTALSMHVEALRRWFGRGTADLERRVQMVARQVMRMRRLVDQLLDTSRVTTGRLELERETFDVCELVREVAERFEEEAARSGVTLDVRTPGPVRGNWDRMRLDEVITNLLANALRHGAGAPVRILVENLGSRVRLVVQDEGPGVPERDQERVFERFERAVPDQGAGGLGLGLWIVRQIVEAHGGHIELKSRPGAGARFSLDLPRSPAPTPA